MTTESRSITHTPEPVPPCFHLVNTSVTRNAETGEIEQLLFFHGGKSIAIAYTPALARSAAADLGVAAYGLPKAQN